MCRMCGAQGLHTCRAELHTDSEERGVGNTPALIGCVEIQFTMHY